MIVYLLIFALSFWAFSFAGNAPLSDRKKKEKDVLIISMFFLAFFVGIADMLGGYDRYIYAELFDNVADNITYGRDVTESIIFEEYYGEKGYGWYNVIIGYITQNRYIFILITTIVIYYLLYISLRDYCSNYPFAIIVFLGLWFFFTFTYLRQVLGATIAWLAIRYIVQRKLWKFLIVWFIAFKFHNSAAIFLPLYFIPIKKYNNRYIIGIMVVAFLLGLTGGPTALFAAYGEMNEERAGVVGNEVGFRIAYMLEAVFFLYIIISKYKEIPEKPINIVMLNMALAFCAILLFFVRNENGGRLSWYYMIGIISTITYLCTQGKEVKRYSNLIMGICFFLYFRIVSMWGVLLSPYKTFFSSGIRQGDFIEQKYEYDHTYDDDKLYRPIFRFLGN